MRVTSWSARKCSPPWARRWPTCSWCSPPRRATAAISKPVLTPPEAARRLRLTAEGGAKTGLLFGNERAGLDNEELSLAAAIITIPTAEFASLNLGQAVLLNAYEWFRLGDETPAARIDHGPLAKGASNEEMQHLFAHLEDELLKSGFLYPPNKAAAMIGLPARHAAPGRAYRPGRAHPAGGDRGALPRQAPAQFGGGGFRLAKPGLTPYIPVRESGCGRRARQPGQVRKEAAVTNPLRVAAGLPPHPQAAKIQGAHPGAALL